MEKFQRNQEGSRVYYDVRSSKGNYYYEVEMLSGNAVSCQCRDFCLGRHFCKHMTIAEQEEAKFQTEQGETPISPPEAPYLNASLNGNNGFSMLRKPA